MKRLLYFSLLSSFIYPPIVMAVDDLTDIRAELLSLVKRVENLEAENRQLRNTVQATSKEARAVASTPKNNEKRWTDTIAISGDLRTRYESFNIDGRDDRERSRVRARISLKATPTDNTEVAIGLASGGDDPVSTNQSLGGGSSTKDIRLDMAYFKWHARPGLTLTGGKMKTPFFRPGGNGLLWDNDLRPEGLAIRYASNRLFANGGLHFLESDTRRSNSRIAYGFQTGYKGKIELGQLIAGVSYFKLGADGRGAWFDNNFFGNTIACVDASCVYNNDFEELELFAELKTTITKYPLTLFVDYVQNQDASDHDTAWALGLKLGKASLPRTWEFGYTYQDVEADSLLGLWSDSDFGGGDTDTKGHIFKGAWAPNKNWKFGFTYFVNERGLHLGEGEDYNRLQIDWAFKF